VTERYRVRIGSITAIGASGIDSPRAAADACLAETRGRLGDLGKCLDCPFTREDLVLNERADALLDELLFEARDRTRFWENPTARRLFPRGTGLVALLTGPPGTGKTMMAQVVARDLDVDLVRIDVASSVSKYIGETAKNLRRIFAQAADMNAVLLFDEADALFTKRTEVRDAHDRYANTDTNYLLQLLEDFPGTALLASNKKNNIDPAFMRRIRYVFDFRLPDRTERLRIWQRLVSELLAPDIATSLAGALEALAETLSLSGAQIKLALLAASFAARQASEPLSAEHLCHGCARELGKCGQNLGPSERERILRLGK
jgi:SpoVK/Ycf46/Vps4 family AAA+-type ATPase